jgi:hypothetical protein
MPPTNALGPGMGPTVYPCLRKVPIYAEPSQRLPANRILDPISRVYGLAMETLRRCGGRGKECRIKERNHKTTVWRDSLVPEIKLFGSK